MGRRAVRLGGGEAHPVTWAAAPLRRTTRRACEVRKRILKAALDCFSAFGFEGTSTRAVAERAQVTHALVLYHFKLKEQLWIATMDAALICPLLGGPSTIIVWTTKEEWNVSEAQARGDHRQAA